MDVRYLVLILFFLSSCLPSPTVTRGDLSSPQTTSGSTSGGTTPTSSLPTNLTWNYLGQLTNTITVNVSNLNNAYIVGVPVDQYLSDATQFSNVNYCLVSSYSINGISHELRSRIVPISYYDFKAKKTIRNFRVDFHDVTNSNSICNKTARVIDSTTGQYVIDPTTPSVASNKHYDPSQLCTSCSFMLVSTRSRVFKIVSSTNMDEVPSNYINTTSLNLQIDPNYSTSSNAGTCTNNECKGKGFDCCLENQCVKDGAQKPSASTTYASLLQTAEEERLQNPLAYLNYPQLYYICGINVPPTGGSTAGSSGGVSSYDPAFLQLKKDYQCIEHIKSQSNLIPFHNQILTTSFTGTTDCLTLSSESSQTFYFQNVFKRLYTTCGCNRTDLTDMIANCPNYEYTVTTKDSQGQPIRIDCYTPPSNANVIPLQQTVSVPSRSAPHRFYDIDGVERNPSDGIEQEGDAFEYLDDGKILPSQQNFSMNAILGQISIGLDKALPAKSVNVDIDQVYIISTASGYYTPCPTCAKDSWLSSFSAFPSSSTGVGLQAVGYTTERDLFSTNTTGGNYEDTIFGRACWIPPTMIPFSHDPKATVVEQRRNRLQAQAALFANGYQRDWFGFNKGALIGSFDGVSWFAIGKGRIVRSTSKKLFLAINAPFADLAAATIHSVRVQAYDGVTQAAQVDYDPQFHQTHPLQNEAGNCQKFHICNTDTDCVTKLGWEYACADVKDLRTNWPEFDFNGNEKANISNVQGIDQILQQKRFPSSSTKRCVYRGSGAICHTDSGSLSVTEVNKKKLLTCGPNFYCANLGMPSHNNKIARFAAPLEEIPTANNHFFGKDANILGRPLEYLGTSTLLSSIQTTIRNNVIPFESTLSMSTGLCQPGKNLPTLANESTLKNPFTQHKSGDSLKRSDFISQIGSCNSGLFTTNRHSSCPVIGADGNYSIFFAGVGATYSQDATAQNACGLESLLSTASLTFSTDALKNYSPFRNIEAKPLNSQIIVDPTLSRDACFRRAGAVCHTDLDCSPNKMHATQVDFFNTNFFGNEAEKSYWSEYLVCGQADPKPFPSTTDTYRNYDMGKNRCCREIGKDLTTYTADLPQDTFVSIQKPYNSISKGLKMSIQAGTIPNDVKRYSRLASVENIGTITRPILTSNITRDVLTTNALTDTPNITTPGQWNTLTEANSESCCGGGWVRKFSDGSNDWSKRDRVVLDVNNFKCINSSTPLITDPEVFNLQGTGDYGPNEATSLVSEDYGDYCKDITGAFGACAQYTISDNFNDIQPGLGGAPENFSPAITINTISPSYTTQDFYFQPRSADANASTLIDTKLDYSTNTGARTNISIKIPSYITKRFDNKYSSLANDSAGDAGLKIELTTSTLTTLTCKKDHGNTSITAFNSTPPATCPTNDGNNKCCFFTYDTNTRVLKVGLTAGTWNDTAAPDLNDKTLGLLISGTSLQPPGTSTNGTYIANTLKRIRPGSSSYYLRRLGRLELSGIPQIAFEELYCSDNHTKLVPGIFKSVKTKLDFGQNNFSWSQSYDSNLNILTTTTPIGVIKRFTNYHGLQHEPVFSQNDFKCCAPLGKTVTDQTQCCSGFGVQIGTSNSRTCALPSGTNLMVYFNRLVSNEGVGTDKPGGGLIASDFTELTGEPKILSTVTNKIRAMGEAYCASGRVRQGGAFGAFTIQPQGSQTNLTQTNYGIIDSIQDIGQNSNAGTTVQTGYPAFSDGFRWNHHLYCDEDQ